MERGERREGGREGKVESEGRERVGERREEGGREGKVESEGRES